MEIKSPQSDTRNSKLGKKLQDRNLWADRQAYNWRPLRDRIPCSSCLAKLVLKLQHCFLDGLVRHLAQRCKIPSPGLGNRPEDEAAFN